MTASDLLTQVRSQIDETNVENVSDQAIVNALNRGQRSAVEITARKYPEMFLANTIINTGAAANGQANALDFPESVFAGRIEKLELVRSSSVPYEMKRISYRDVTNMTTTTVTTLPEYWAVLGRQVIVYPNPAAGQPVRVWFIQSPPNIVLPQGRVVGLNLANNYVVVDKVGSTLTTDSASNNSYVNIADAQTGAVKATLQIAAFGPTVVGPVTVPTNGILFKAVPTRATVLNTAVVGALPAAVDFDDEMSTVYGAAVSSLPESYQDYLIQYAVVEIRRKLGIPLEDDSRALGVLEEKLQHQWAGREQQHRVKNANQHWVRLTRRRW